MSDLSNTTTPSAFERLVRSRWYGAGGILGLSKASGVSRATLYSWFRGETVPDTKSLSRLSAVLDVPLADLVGALHPEQGHGAGQPLAPAFPAAPGTVRATVQTWSAILDDDGPRLLTRQSVPGRVTIGEALGRGHLAWCSPDDPIGPVARALYEGHFSQVPVRGERGWMALLTTEAVARWMAGRSRHELDVEARAPVREVLAYADDARDFRVVPAETSVQDVLDLFDSAVTRGQPLKAVLVSTAGQGASADRIVTPFDLPRLRQLSAPERSRSR